MAWDQDPWDCQEVLDLVLVSWDSVVLLDPDSLADHHFTTIPIVSLTARHQNSIEQEFV